VYYSGFGMQLFEVNCLILMVA